MNNIDKNIQSLPKLLRAIANGDDAKKNKQDIIFNEAANLIEHLAKIREVSKQLVKEHQSEK
jgi:hypothetical protein